jgi:Zn-dependent M16 (insulinase) family peptidase
MAQSDFKQLRTQKIDSLNVVVEEYEHVKTGAKHYHLVADNDENVFLVALRTMPMDSTGVAHILEHTALCGSEKFPVRDPFFMMIRRSLNTFMNAFTSSDWTAYPFASKNKKDFNNLLAVYLDSVFAAKLDPMDFAQEGHRLEFEDPADKTTPLQFKGVVYNEMKGAMSSVPSQLWHTLTKHLYPTNTYHYNSGGDPETILDLSYEELLAFYKRHYHPSNAIFMTYGDIPASEHQKAFSENINHFEPLEKKLMVQDEKRYFAPMSAQESYGLNETEAKTHHVMGWLLGHSANLDEQLEAHFLSSLLLENSGSPLRLALETTDLATAPSPLCGLEDSNKEMCFVCGVEGSEIESKEDVEKLILSTLEKVASDGVTQDQIDSVLHQLELSQREVGGDGYPFGLQIILSAISACTHYSDPVELLNLDPALDRLREKSKSGSFVGELINKYLLNNTHRVTLTFAPDTELDQRKNAAEQDKLTQIFKSLSDLEIEDIVTQGVALKERQMQKDDESLLPKVTLDDVAGQLNTPKATDSSLNNGESVASFEQGTNGLSYHQVLLPLPQLTESESLLLPVLLSYLTEMGVAGDDYLATQQKQSLLVGGISAFASVRNTIANPDECIAYWVLSGKALARNHEGFFQLMMDTLLKADLTDASRIKDLLSQSLSRKEQSITGNGHGLAMNIASSGMNAASRLSYLTSGIASLPRLRDMVAASDTPEGIADITAQMTDLYKKINSVTAEHLLISDASNLNDAHKMLDKTWSIKAVSSQSDFSFEKVSAKVSEAWVVPTQTNFCAKAYPTVGANHEDAAVLSVLAGYLRNGYLHTKIREQGGAYGGGATQDSAAACFKFYSYRDPRFKGTYDDFTACISWFADHTHESAELEQAILGVVSGIDKPSSPAGEAKQAFHNDKQGRTAQWRNEFRQRVLNVKLEDLTRVMNTYFDESKASFGAIISSDAKKDALDMSMTVNEL